MNRQNRKVADRLAERSASKIVRGDAAGVRQSNPTANPEMVSRCVPRAKQCAMSVDVEDYFQVWAFSDVISRKSWDGIPMRVEGMIHRILDLFDKHETKATFFTLGWVAERAPGLVREITARGHEIASHGYDHAKVFDQQKEEFSEDVKRTKKILEEITGVSVVGYRAPGFSIGARTPWAYDVLARAGYQYSSSSHPIAHDHYGDPGASRDVHLPIAGQPFAEAPVATANFLGRRVSCAGGGWFRATPYPIARRFFDLARNDLVGPAIFYFHPWEIDPDQPRIRTASVKSKLRHYLNLDRMEAKLGNLLSDYSWRRIDEALGIGQIEAAV